jgi:hypothetical protein
LQESEYSDISECECSSDSEINVKILSYRGQSVSSDEKDVSDNSSMQHGICTKSGAKQPRFPFTGKPSKNVDLKDPSEPLEQSEFFVDQILRK